jgi:hypothetical protein
MCIKTKRNTIVKQNTNKIRLLLDNIYMKCNHNIPQARLDLGYTECVDCSTVQKLGCIDTINHKTGNSIQVMSREDADKANKLTKRAGFGILISMTGGSSQRKTKIIHGCSTTQIGSQEMYERVGKTYMDYLDVDKEIAERYLDRALDNAEVSQLQYNKIKMLCHKLNTITIG